MQATSKQPPIAARVAVLASLSVQVTGSDPTERSTSVPGAITLSFKPGSRKSGSSKSGEEHRYAFYYGGGELAALGAAVRWAAVQKADELHLVSEAGVGNDIARRAGHLNTPFEIVVWQMAAGKFSKLEAGDLLQPPELPASHIAFSEVIVAAGAQPVDDHGRLIAEVLGLEVARVTETSQADGSTVPGLEIGVGQADRELHEMIHGQVPKAAGDAAEPEALRERLTKVVEDVTEMRQTGGVEHPLARVALQRRIRAAVIDNPSHIGAASLAITPPLRRRETVLGDEPAAAVGRSLAGRPLVAICSAGVDLDLAAEAGDYRHRFDDAAELVVVVPERDVYLIEPTISEFLTDVRVISAPQF